MIKLNVREYCQSCTEFDPDVEYPTTVRTTNGSGKEIGDTIIRCKNRDRCEKIKNHLENYITRRRTND